MSYVHRRVPAGVGEEDPHQLEERTNWKSAASVPLGSSTGVESVTTPIAVRLISFSAANMAIYIIDVLQIIVRIIANLNMSNYEDDFSPG